MINLMKMNFYRLLHTHSMYVVLFITLCMSGVSSYMSLLDTEIEQQWQEQQVQTDDTEDASGASEDQEGHGLVMVQKVEPEEVDFGIAVAVPETDNGIPASFLEHFCADIGSGLLLIFFSIAASLFFYAEEKSGFVKNISGQTKYKPNIYLSKMIPMCGYFFVSMVCYGLVQFAFLKYHYGNEIAFGMDSFGKAMQVIGLQFLLHAAFISGVMMLVTVCKSTAVSITIGILAACGFGSILTGFVQKALDIDINPYLLHSNIQLVNWDAPRTDLLHALGIGIVFLLLYNLIGTVWFTKKDVR